MVVNAEPTQYGADGSELPRLLYTGTCTGYFREVVRRYGRFEHSNGNPVCLSDSPLTAISCATQRSRFYDDLPLVLVVDTDKRREPLTYDGTYYANSLDLGCFVPYGFIAPVDGDMYKAVYARICRAEDRARSASVEELQRDVLAFL